MVGNVPRDWQSNGREGEWREGEKGSERENAPPRLQEAIACEAQHDYKFPVMA